MEPTRTGRSPAMMIGRDGRLVSADPADDWLASTDVEAHAHPETDARAPGGALGLPPIDSEDADPSPTRSFGMGRDATGPSEPPEAVRRRLVTAITVLLVLVAVAIAAPLKLLVGNSPALKGDGGEAPGNGSATQPPAAKSTPPPSAAPRETEPAAPRASSAPAAPSIVLPSSGKLWRGDTGKQVERLQSALVLLGHEPGTPDGVFGRRTQAAVVAFQRARGIAPDGIVGERTLAALEGALAAAGK